MAELRFLINPRAPHTEGCSKFIIKHYAFLKGLNPEMTFLVRETANTSWEPVVEAVYQGFKANETTRVTNMTEEQIFAEVKRFNDVGIEHNKHVEYLLPDII
ncbi:hypothetical protein GUITHDRAFT_150904 [Guillardia theta CCMP2712]|uniref:Ribosomal protein/NADH dehydrogenase domain-containing protein n=1 Tax=Guillardia theta (strain CCMP2712) TaxID=905079 RepID=L1JTB1_GUITC|nr:hypothetical protein GUITHDRAFT_150904 [Guillardia theta CCMP2712]EKX51435.1 hypothetical protein GUITHDRAFT_150904 [Guillardia theta CCMP2712]|eukprot:XP_005838415.1 hypothetical protein GUITHDRAFT_150904 [Guillardia theta CCMP2712]